MKLEMHRDGRWLECSSWRLQRSVHHKSGQVEAGGYYGGPIAPPWRLLDGNGVLVASSEDTKRRHEGGASAVETDESPTTAANSTEATRTAR